MSSLADDTSTHLTHANYFALEKDQQKKFEYLAGEVFAMTGGSYHHSLISTNTLITLGNALRDTPCTVLNSDIKLYIDTLDSFFYPDAMVLCKEGKISKHYVQSPQLIIKVLSPSTEDYDHNRKFAYYRQINTLKTYMMLHQDRPLAEVYQRGDQGWLLNDYEGLETVITLQDELALAMSELYRRVDY